MLTIGKKRLTEEALHNDLLRQSLPIKKIVGLIRMTKKFGGIPYNYAKGPPFYMIEIPMLPDKTNWTGNYESVLKDYFKDKFKGLDDEMWIKFIVAIFNPFNKNSHSFRLNLTPEVCESEHVLEILQAVENHKDFPEGDDPYGLHDFGAFSVGDKRWFFKYDFFEDKTLAWGWDPLDENRRAYRLLTILCSSEY